MDQRPPPAVIRRGSAVPANLVQTACAIAFVWALLFVIIPVRFEVAAHVGAGLFAVVSLVRVGMARVLRYEQSVKVVNKWLTHEFPEASRLEVVPVTPWWTPVGLAGAPTCVGFRDAATGRTRAVYALGFMNMDKMPDHPAVVAAIGNSRR